MLQCATTPNPRERLGLQGYIINITPQKNEDIILTILTPHKIKRLYRFYGARHSILQLGKKIDFEVENGGVFLPRARNIMALNFAWEREIERVRIWQRYLQLLHKHFHDIESTESFYYDMLELGASKILRQNPLRVALEMYAMLLDFEGRIPDLSHCFICSEPITEELAIARALLPAHPACIRHSHTASLNKNAKIPRLPQESLQTYLQTHSTAHLNDDKIHELWGVLIQGL